MPFKKLSIRNFQAHAKLAINLDPKVNVIVGRTDAGKSSILRAIRWVCTNKPNGEAFMREGSGHISVRLQTEDNEILRERGPGLNGYSLDGHRYQAFGQDVPADIEKVLNIGPVNFQGQHDAPFWFLLSAGEVSRELNQIINLGKIDSSLAFIATTLRKARSEVELTESRLKKAEETKAKWEWVKEADQDLKEIEGIERHLLEINTKIDRLQNGIAIAEKTKQAFKESKVIKEEAKAVLVIGEELKQHKNKIKDLEFLLSEIEREKETWLSSMAKTKDAKKELKILEKLGCPLCGKPM